MQNLHPAYIAANYVAIKLERATLVRVVHCVDCHAPHARLHNGRGPLLCSACKGK